MSEPRAVGASIAFVGGLLIASQAVSETLPLWEFGLGGGGLVFSDYRGADGAHAYPIPVPYFVYRGRLLQADRDGVHGLLAGSPNVDVKLNVGITTPVRSSETRARKGMPDLYSTLELGPSVEVHLWRSADRLARLDLRMPVPAAMTLSARPQLVGWQFTPRLNLDVADVAGRSGWNLGLLAGPLYADRSYNDYFYSVAPAYATADRAAYEARGGYGGAQLLVSLTKRFPRYWVGAFIRHDWLDGAVFMDSPLVHSSDYWMGGFGIAWIIHSSTRSIDVADAWLR